jgi:hypothetical protein
MAWILRALTTEYAKHTKINIIRVFRVFRGLAFNIFGGKRRLAQSTIRFELKRHGIIDNDEMA